MVFDFFLGGGSQAGRGVIIQKNFGTEATNSLCLTETVYYELKKLLVFEPLGCQSFLLTNSIQVSFRTVSFGNKTPFSLSLLLQFFKQQYFLGMTFKQ